MSDNQKKYIPKIFAFLDILGFEELVNESRRTPELVDRIANILHRSKEIALSIINAKLSVLKVDPTQYRYRAFSDTSVISASYTSHDDIDFLSMWIMFYQYLMWKEERIFLRGSIVYGDIYEDEDVVFGPALIDAYHLEKDQDKAVWPRVVIDKSLRAKITDTELRRDFFEFMRRDEDNLVYLDYLRELFHYLVLAQNKKVIGQRNDDFGPPSKLFEGHKEAIMTQVGYALKKEDDDEAKNILRKYVKLSEYHNSTIDRLRLVVNNLMTDNSIVLDLFNDQLQSVKANILGIEYKPKYSVEEHPEQADMLNILGPVISRLLSKLSDKHQEDYITDLEVTDTICRETPHELSTLDMSLRNSMIDIDSFS